MPTGISVDKVNIPQKEAFGTAIVDTVSPQILIAYFSSKFSAEDAPSVQLKLSTRTFKIIHSILEVLNIKYMKGWATSIASIASNYSFLLKRNKPPKSLNRMLGLVVNNSLKVSCH